MKTSLQKLDHAVQAILRLLCILLFIALGLILLTNVAMRVVNDLSNYLIAHQMPEAGAIVKMFAPITSMHWFDEIVELCFAALVFYGAAALWGIKGHFSVGDWISSRLPGESSRAFYKLVVNLMSLVFIGVFFWFSLSLCLRTTELSTVFQIPKGVMYSCMPIASFIMLVYSLVDVVQDLARLFGAKEMGSKEQGMQSM